MAPVRQRPTTRLAWRLARFVACAAVVALAPGAAAAQSGLLVQGLADLELWKTDARSALLARNEGRLALLGRVHLWGAWQPRPGLSLYALGEIEGGPGAEETERALDQFGVRWEHGPALVLDAGRLTSPVGAFGGRRLSNRNPLVGAPDGYPVTYPLGAQLSGARGIVDWRAAVVSLPVTHEDYTPEPSARARPAFGVGLTPATGLRVGASWTRGPYLNRDLAPALLAGGDWCDFAQEVLGLDLEASRGYLELWGEAGWTAHEVPGRARPVRGTAGYLEARWTLSPRWYLAGRAETNRYPFIASFDGASWTARATEVRDAEAGVGFRLGASTLVKASWRRDQWRVAPDLRDVLPDGSALALQLSHGFDVGEAWRRLRD